jgi:tryptophan-rich sensory protein
MSNMSLSRPTAATSPDVIRQVVNIFALIATIAFNSLSQSLRLGGTTSAEISKSYPVFFVPANFTFSIWGVIFLLLIGFTVYQALPLQRENHYARQIGWFFVVSCVLNCAWLTAFHYRQFLLSVPIMLGLLATLATIYVRLRVGRDKVSNSEHWLYHVPFSVYLGWISVATIANLTVTLYDAGWDGFGINGPVWAAIMLVVGGLLCAYLLIMRRDIAFTFVILWAFGGIVNKQAETPLVAGTALVIIVGLIVLLGMMLLRNWGGSLQKA